MRHMQRVAIIGLPVVSSEKTTNSRAAADQGTLLGVESMP
jgi:hypothetical protein